MRALVPGPVLGLVVGLVVGLAFIISSSHALGAYGVAQRTILIVLIVVIHLIGKTQQKEQNGRPVRQRPDLDALVDVAHIRLAAIWAVP